MNESFKNFIRNKNIAIIGNAESVFNKTRPIDSHDIVVRINKGSPKGKEAIIGERTDILALSLPLEEEEITQGFNPKYIVWCTPKHESMTEYLKENALIFPKSYWEILYGELNARPSTGCMIMFYLFPYCESISLYGFDFWKTNNWYTQNIHFAKHDPKSEEKFMKFLLRNGHGRVIE